MKSTHILFAVLFLVGCVISSCTKDKLPTETNIPDTGPTDPNLPPSGSGVLTANIDGLSWAAEDIAGIPSGTSTYNGSILHISGGRAVVGDTADAETIDLVIDLSSSKAYIVPGTYALGTIPAQAGEAQHSDGLICVCHTSSAQSGTVTITTLDVARKIVSGRFVFNGIGVGGETHVISEGKFDVAWM
jgi:hypothetical protein